MKYMVSADMGSIKVYTKDVSLFVSNGGGDGPRELQILTNPTPAQMAKTHQGDFINHFTVKEKGVVHISGYDCTSGDPIYTFDKIGRYFCYGKEGKVTIAWLDGETHA